VARSRGAETDASATAAAGELSGDVGVLVEHVATVHPDPWHDVSEEEVRAAAAELDADSCRATTSRASPRAPRSGS